ncbi:MAG: hypothetical protein M0Q92_05260 [Methanoregula sp.]|jgi:hypothetical protein|nr:hypothetical protein [Methanoregula sp.]
MIDMENKVKFYGDFENIAWEQYTSLEDEFLCFLKFVPLDENHYDTWSLVLGNLLNNTGSSIDSFFKNALTFEKFDTIENIEKIRTDEKYQNMTSYRNIFDSSYGLSQKEIFENKLWSKIIPFSSWSDNKSPDWWKNYTDFKHDRFSNRRKATVKITLNALGGLFLLNVIHLETRMILFRDGFIHAPEPIDISAFREIISKTEPLDDIDRPVYAKSRLFGYIFEPTSKIINDTEKITILSPWFNKSETRWPKAGQFYFNDCDF